MDIHYHRLEGFQGIETISGIEAYGKRAAVLCQSEDILLLDTYPQLEIPIPELELLHEAGLGPKAENIFAVDFNSAQSWEQNLSRNREVLQRLKEMNPRQLMPFTAKSKIIHQLASYLGVECHRSTSELAFWAENKGTLLELQKLFGSAPRGFICHCREDFSASWQKLRALENFTGEAVIKPFQGASGLLSAVVKTEKHIEEFLAKARLDTGVITEWYDTKVSPSVNYWMTEKGVEELFVSDQLFEDTPPVYGREGARIYAGNSYPSQLPKDVQKRVVETVRPYAEYFFGQGYRGPVGFDTVISDGQIYVVEANPRVTGPHYAFFPARARNSGAFFIRNEVIDKSLSLAQLRSTLGDLYLQTGDAQGYFVFNVSPGKFTGVLLARDSQDMEALKECLEHRLQPLRSKKWTSSCQKKA